MIKRQQRISDMKKLKSSRPTRSGQRRFIGLAGGAVLALSTLLPMLVTGGQTSAAAGTANSSSGSGSSAAVITPLLEFFEFGNSIGTPLLCSDAGSVISIVGVQGGAGALSTPLVNELSTLCSGIASQGGSYLQQAIDESQSLSLINPIVNPLIAGLANGFSTVGTDYGPSLAPFGPTVGGPGRYGGLLRRILKCGGQPALTRLLPAAHFR